MKPTALIAEDEPLLAASLAAELGAVWPELSIVARVGDGASAVVQALARQPSVCFLDIRMPGLSGLEAAQALAEDWPDDGAPFPLLVFVTAYDQYALAAFEAQAADYLVKPLDSARLRACTLRLQKRLAERSEQTSADATLAGPLPQTLAQLRSLLAAPAAASRLEMIQASVGSLVHLIPVDEVLYFEAADKYLRVVTAQREHLIRLSLRELIPQIDPQRFWQVHRGLVVQARAIATAQRDESGKVFLTLRGRDERLVASRLYAHLFRGM
jgi:DNA-binding LytR/AlgR family response regulator